jgi:uncharacterized protein (TIGR03067 family)
MRRLTLGLIALTLLPAFAPAPFPRAGRADRDEMSLKACQGTWEVISNESVQGTTRTRSDWGITHVRIRGSRWTLMTDGREIVSYTIAVDGARRPAHIDWFPLEQPAGRTLWTGLIKREGERVLILYSDGGSPANRPRDFHSARANSYLITVRRGG